VEKIVAPNGEILNIRTPAEQHAYEASAPSMPTVTRAEGTGVAGQSEVDGKAFTSGEAAKIYDLVKQRVPELIELPDGSVVAAADVPDLIDSMVQKRVREEMRLNAIREEQAKMAAPFEFATPSDALDVPKEDSDEVD